MTRTSKKSSNSQRQRHRRVLDHHHRRRRRWMVFKSVIEAVHGEKLTITDYTWCFLNDDCSTLESIKTCSEYTPFQATVIV